MTGLCCCAQHCDQRRFFPLLYFGSGRRRCCCELASPLRGGRLKCDPQTPTPCRASDGCLQHANNSALGTTCCQSVCAMGTPCDVSVGHGNPYDVLLCHGNNNNNNILDSSQREIKAVVQSHNEEHISIILSHETHAHTHSSTYAPFLSH